MDIRNTNIQISRNGYYTVTFENTSAMTEKEVRNELGSVGEVCAVVWKGSRVFIRFRRKEEAQKALMKYGKILNLRMAYNNKQSVRPQQLVGQPCVGEEEDDDEEEDLKELKGKSFSVSKFKVPESNVDSENINTNHGEKNFCLILSNLPKNYLLKDVKALIEETKPLWVELDETKVFNVRFAYIIVDSLEKVTYLMEKLNGFVICGEKLGAMEANKLLKWRYNGKKIAT